MNLDYIFWEEMPPMDFFVDQKSTMDSLGVSFARDEDYRLSVELTANKMDPIFVRNLQDQNVMSFDIKTSSGAITGKLEDVLYEGGNWSPKEAKIKARASKLVLNYEVNKKEEAKTTIYWFLSNIKNSNIEFSRLFHYKTAGNAKLNIEGFIDDVIEMPLLKESVSRTVFLLEFKGNKFCFGKVGEKYTGKDCGGIFLRFEAGSFPDPADLETIVSFLSFVCGGIIIPIGHIKFGEHYSIIEQCYVSTFRRNIRQILRTATMPAIPLDISYWINKKVTTAQMEEKISGLLKKYALNEKLFILDKITIYIKCAHLSVFDVMLQPLFTGIDLLQQIWFKSNKTSSGGKYLDEQQFANLLSSDFLEIEKKLTDCPEKQKIMNKLKNANHFTLSDREKKFFSEIGLKVGLVEEEILKERNKTFHGEVGTKDFERLIVLTHGAYALINRIILKFLDYAGDYVDYSTHEYPHRAIDETLMGPENNGVI